MNRWLICCLLLSAAIAAAQSSPSKKKAPAAPAAAPSAPVVTDELTAYLLPIELQKQTRDLQLDYSELETANQTMTVQIEKNKQKQRDVTEAIQKIWYEFAVSKQIDLKVWEPDPKALKFVKKKAAAK
jgi:TolA-binding protein